MKGARKAAGRGMTWSSLVSWATRLPGVEPGTSYGTPALKVRKTLLARLREDGETVAVRIDPLDRDVVLEADPAAFFLTDHYRPYPWVVMRLDQVRPAVAHEMLEQAWRRAAPRSLVAGRGSAPPAPPARPGRRKRT